MMMKRIPYRLRAGSWQPARLRWIDHAVLMIVLIIIAYVRGFDYLIGNDQWGARDFMIAVAPEWVWGGIGFVTGATILAFGVTTKRHLMVYIGHGWLMAAYGLNALALVLATGPPLAVPIMMLGTAILLLSTSVIHKLSRSGKGAAAFALVLSTAALGAASMQFGAPFDGIRGSGAVGFVALLHLIHMIRTGGRPLRVEQSTATERVVDGETND